MTDADRRRARVGALILVAAVVGGCGGAAPLSRRAPDGGGGAGGSAPAPNIDASSDGPAAAAPDASPDAPPAPDDATSSDDRCDSCAVDSDQEALVPDATPSDVVSHVDGSGCVKGFAHCTTNPDDRCETDITTPDHCGYCGTKCMSNRPSCVPEPDGAFSCVAACPAGRVHCGEPCVDVNTDPSHCGSCDVSCNQTNVVGSCAAGVCSVAACFVGFATCAATSTTACGTRLDTAQNCGACGNASCGVAHTLLTCAGGSACDHPVCAAGFANCDMTSPDCETALGAAAACFPSHLGTLAFGAAVIVAIAIASDGSIFLTGSFGAPTDFDPGPGKDTRAPKGTNDAFLTKLAADGTHAWTITFGSATSNTDSTAIALTGTSITLLGGYSGAVDFDPGPGQAVLPAPGGGWVATFTLDGKLVWASPFTGTGSCGVAALAVDATGAVYVAGGFEGMCDLDPGPAIDAHTSTPTIEGFLVKLASGDGHEVWARTFSGPSCQGSLEAVAISGDGNVWATGGMSGACSVGAANIDTTDSVVASFTPAGDVHFVAAVPAALHKLVASADGSIYVGGLAAGTVDFDPGPGTTNRSLPGNDGNEGGFVAKLAADGTFRWVETLARVPVVSLAATSDSGVIAVGNAFVDGSITGFFATKLGGDSTSVWSIGADGASLGLFAVAGGASTYVFVGLTDAAAADVVPGPTTLIVPAHTSFVSRYAF